MNYKLTIKLFIFCLIIITTFGCQNNPKKVIVENSLANTNGADINKNAGNTNRVNANIKLNDREKYRELDSFRKGLYRTEIILVAPDISDKDLSAAAKEIRSKHAEAEKQTMVYYVNTTNIMDYEEWAKSPKPDLTKIPANWMHDHIVAHSVLATDGTKKLNVYCGIESNLITSFD